MRAGRSVAGLLIAVLALLSAACSSDTSADSTSPDSDAAAAAAAGDGGSTQVDPVPAAASTPDPGSGLSGLRSLSPPQLVADGVGGFVDPGVVVVITEQTGRAGEAAIGEALKQIGGVLGASVPDLGVFQVAIASDDVLLTAESEAFNNADGIRLAGVSRAYLPTLSQTPDDPDDPVWDDADVLWPYELLGVTDFWETSSDVSGDGVGVLIPDYGLYGDHPDLGFASPVQSLFGDSAETRLQYDVSGVSHGTAIAGIVCGSHNGSGAFGVVDGCDLHGFDLYYDLFVTAPDRPATLGDPLLTSVAFASNIDWAIKSQPGIKVVNTSWAFGPRQSDCEMTADPISVFLMYLLMSQHPDVLFVTAAGNCGNTIPAVSAIEELFDQATQIPAAFASLLPNVVSVTAINKDLTLPSWANRGPGVTVAAPGGENSDGEGIWGAGFVCDGIECTPEIVEGAGTSYAAPFVTGVAVAMYAANPDLGPADIAACLGAPGARSVDGIPIASLPAAIACATGATATPTPEATATPQPSATPEPTATPPPLPESAVTHPDWPDLYGVAVDGGMLLVIDPDGDPVEGWTGPLCTYSQYAYVAYDEAATAFSYTQSFRGETYEVFFAYDRNLNGTRRNAPVTGDAAQGLVRSHLEGQPPGDLIGYPGFGRDGFAGYTSVGGEPAACEESAQVRNDAWQPAVTNPTQWFRKDGKPRQPFPKMVTAYPNNSTSESLVVLADDYWENPPAGHEFGDAIVDGDTTTEYLLGPAYRDKRVYMTRVTGTESEAVFTVGLVEPDFDPKTSFDEGDTQTAINFTVELLTVTDQMVRTGQVQGEAGWPLPLYDDLDCANCRLATPDELGRLRNFGMRRPEN